MNKIKESDLVYQALRDEIIQVETAQHTYRSQMHVIFFAFWGFAMKWRTLYLAALLLLLIFQTFFDFQGWLRIKVSAYIQVFFEEKRDDIHWEKFNRDETCSAAENICLKQLSSQISEHSAGILAVITALFHAIALFREPIYPVLNQTDLLLLVGELALSIFLCGLVLTVSSQTRKKKLRKHLFTAATNYKQKLEAECCQEKSGLIYQQAEGRQAKIAGSLKVKVRRIK